MLRMVSYSRHLKSGQITCYLNRTYHVLPTPVAVTSGLDSSVIVHCGPKVSGRVFLPLVGVRICSCAGVLHGAPTPSSFLLSRPTAIAAKSRSAAGLHEY